MTPTMRTPSAERYSRQSLIVQDGRTWDQAQLDDLRVLLVGAGNIGDPVGVALARAGVRWIDIADLDTVSEANLSRGVSYLASDVGQPKALVLARHLKEINPSMHSDGIVADIRFEFGTARFREYDVVVLATHDLASRLHVNRYVHLLPGRTRAIVEGAIDDLSFSVQTILPGDSPCYACPLPPDQTDPNAYPGCNGVVIEQQSTPAATNGLDGLAAAALMAKEVVLLGAGLQPFFTESELRFDGPVGRASVYQRPRRESCAEHRRASSEEIFTLPYGPDTTIRELRELVAGQWGVTADRVLLASPQLLTTYMTCTGCGQRRTVMQPQKAPLRDPACPGCQRDDPNGYSAEFSCELTERAEAHTLRDYGIPSGQALAAYCDSERRYLVPEPLLPGTGLDAVDDAGAPEVDHEAAVA